MPGTAAEITRGDHASKGSRIHNGARRYLIAILMALAVVFTSAGCRFPHIDIPEIHAKVHDINNSDLNNLRKHRPRVEQQGCSGSPADPWYCNDGS
ncbi:MAG TPA: hypothetical protein VHZ03_14990 [Trebonia sp.]|jgi:hypothetical protein|nr:hypothetical protein [Trebonia sp.]